MATPPHTQICAPCVPSPGRHMRSSLCLLASGGSAPAAAWTLAPSSGLVKRRGRGRWGLGSLGLLLLWAATHTWYLSPPCVRVADAKCTCPDPGPLSLLCLPLSPVSELGTPLPPSPRLGTPAVGTGTVYFPFPFQLNPCPRPHYLTLGRTCPVPWPSQSVLPGLAAG